MRMHAILASSDPERAIMLGLAQEAPVVLLHRRPELHRAGAILRLVLAITTR